uniref:Uncharacterized protein n=1 Tax=Aegilops tauschii subsp. strangulata TaxID=200361 RepID=A0A453QVS7_AEGTS
MPATRPSPVASDKFYSQPLLTARRFFHLCQALPFPPARSIGRWTPPATWIPSACSSPAPRPSHCFRSPPASQPRASGPASSRGDGRAATATGPRGCCQHRPWRPSRRGRSRSRRPGRRRSGSTGWTSGTPSPPWRTWTPARRTARWCWGSAWWPGTTAAPASGACSRTRARTAWRRSRRAASTTRAGCSACTTAGASTAVAPASSSPRPPPSAPRYAMPPIIFSSVHGRVSRLIDPSLHESAGAHQQQGVRGVVPVRGAEQAPVVLPARRAGARGRAAAEAAAVHPGDRRPVLCHLLLDKGHALRVKLERACMQLHRVSFLLFLNLALINGSCTVFCRRYDVLAENLMDPSHVPYAHKGLFRGLPRLVDPGRYVPALKLK